LRPVHAALLLAGYAIGIAAWVALVFGGVAVLRWSGVMIGRAWARWQRGGAAGKALRAAPAVAVVPAVPVTGFLDWQAIDAAERAAVADWQIAA